MKSKLLVLLNYTSMVWISSVLYSFKAYFLACSRWILRCVVHCPEHVQNFFWMSFVLSIYDLCPGGKLSDFLFHWNFSNGYLTWNFMENLINFILFVRKIINNPPFLLVKIPSFQEFKVLLLRLLLELLKRKTLPKSYHIGISTMIRPLRVLKAEADLGLRQHPRWSTLW